MLQSLPIEAILTVAGIELFVIVCLLHLLYGEPGKSRANILKKATIAAMRIVSADLMELKKYRDNLNLLLKMQRGWSFAREDEKHTTELIKAYNIRIGELEKNVEHNY